MKRYKTKEQSWIIFTDVGEEIDDEIALFWLFHSGKCPVNLTIVFTMGALKANITPEQRYDTFVRYFPSAPSATYVTDLRSLASVKGRTYTKMLQIAPLRGVPVEFFRDNTFQTLYLMGQRNAASVNTCKTFGERTTESHWREYDAQLAALRSVPTVEIGTAISRLVPFTASIIQKLPEAFRNEILNKAYEQFVGRVPAFLPFCYGVTFEANYHTLMAYVRNISDFERYATAQRNSEHVNTMASGFYGAIKAKPDNANQSTDIEKVKDMILVVEFMTQGQYLDATLQKGEDHFKGYESGKSVWKSMVSTYNCSLTPAYDLLAMYVMANGLGQHQLSDADVLTEQLERAFAAIH